MYQYNTQAPALNQVQNTSGWLLLNFGTDWCGHCQAAQEAVHQWLKEHKITHMAVEDGKGRPLGRAFQVKLWPSLILLRDGEEVARVVRPTAAEHLTPLTQALSS